MSTKKKPVMMMSKSSVTFRYDGETTTILRDDARFEKAVKAYKEERYTELPALLSIPKMLEKTSNGLFKAKNGVVFVDNEEVPMELGRQILDFAKENLPFEPLINFWKNLRNNPSPRAVTSLFSFLEKNKHPITADGKFIAYKKVRPDMKDIHSQTKDYTVGEMVEMPRDQVDSDPNVTCSTGLHVANWDYAKNRFGSDYDTMIEVEIDPKDVVAIPYDYNESKIRVCAMRVREIVVNPQSTTTLAQQDKNQLVEREVSQLEESSHMETCSNCNGEGEFECEECDGTDPACESCNGDGYLDCPTCEGACEVEVFDLSEEEEKELDEQEAADEEETGLVVAGVASADSKYRKMSTDRLEKTIRKLTKEYKQTKSWTVRDALNAVKAIFKSRQN